MLAMLPTDLFRDLLHPLPNLIQAQAQAHFARLGCAAVNHLLLLEPTVQAHLKPHAGRTVLLCWETLWLAPAGEQALRINEDLSLSPANPQQGSQQEPLQGKGVDVTIRVQSGIVSAPAQERLRFVRLEGDVFLAQDLSKVAKELRWDAEHDLARVVGDAPAYWIVRHAKQAATVLHDAALALKARLDETFKKSPVADMTAAATTAASHSPQNHGTSASTSPIGGARP
jgi:ubiquinone biosynthesis accessory factor UbiJ